ncbi:MAG: 50S ribosomal protein L40e [Candidatus Freyarchaeota archaeon]|nr:50S ribosomal protein L40e [Candidatus Jordarchaeia archaeon]MBS7268506.1 50S ribosomal protein L40e [Candidatus Jordarchaeia archaeon]MBS7278502.1 50S ribosomal protein L40e [Candidatus Jordarchaeia archaeon]
MPIGDPDKRRIAATHLLYVKVCRKCYARNALYATKCRRCKSKRLRLKKRVATKK